MVVCLGGLCCYSVLNALLMFKFRLFHAWTPPDNQKWYTSSLWALGWIKRQQNGQNHATVSIYLALWTPNLYVNGAILNDSFECTESQLIVKIAPHCWHSRLVAIWTILICAHTVCIFIYTSIPAGYLHVQNSVWLLCSNPFLTLLSSHIMQTKATQKTFGIAVRQTNPPLSSSSHWYQGD